MTTFLLTLGVIAIVVTGMALGVILQGKRLRGSCGLTGEDCHCTAMQARLCRHVQRPATDEAGE